MAKILKRSSRTTQLLAWSRSTARIAFYLNHKEEVEQVIEERKREEEAYIAAHPTPLDIKEKFERMRRQMLSRRS